MRNLERWEPYFEKHGPSTLWGLVVEGTRENPQVVIRATTKLDAADARLIAATHNAAINTDADRSIYVEAVIKKSGQPVVRMTVGCESRELDSLASQNLVSLIIQAQEASMSDALIIKFVQMHFGDDPNIDRVTMQLLSLFRDYRKQLRGDGPIEAPETPGGS
jgi:hypothetical protein